MIAVLFAVVRIFMHDDDFYHECMGFPTGVRAIAEELPDDVVLEVILLDSGADVSVFPMRLIMQVASCLTEHLMHSAEISQLRA